MDFDAYQWYFFWPYWLINFAAPAQVVDYAFVINARSVEFVIAPRLNQFDISLRSVDFVMINR